MTISKKLGLLAGASALALSMVAMPAAAFDEVNWTWDAVVTEVVTKTVDINIDLAPTGMVMLEDLQVSIGDITAISTVTGISNIQPTSGSAGGPQVIDLGTLNATGNYDPVTGAVTDGVSGSVIENPTFLNGTVNPDSPYGITMNFDLGTITVDPVEGEAGLPLDALTELPEVVSAATAVGNNTTISADTAVQLHEAQWAIGDVAIPPTETDGAGFTWEGVVGIGTAEISATSTVSAILNASVDSSATAVGNNLSVDVVAAGDDRLVIADALQVSVANVTATSDVSDIDVNNYTNLGAIDVPMVNSVATAIGNSKSISVNAPVVAVAP
jgi:hypothetical protein